MAIYDVSVDNTIKYNVSLSQDLYYPLDTTSMVYSVTTSPTSERYFSLANTMTYVLTITPVLFTPYFITYNVSMDLDSEITTGKSIAVNYDNAMNFNASINQYFDIDNRLVRYAPIITGESDMPDSLTRTSLGEMTFTMGSLNLTMPKPDFGDTDTVEVTVHSTALSSGNIIINPQTTTNVRSKSYTFTGICSEKKQEYLTFLNRSFGQIVQLTDFEGVTTDILITSIDSEITETKIGHDIILEYEEV